MKVVKEIFIGIMLFAVVVFTLGIMFYNSMPNNKEVPTAIEYKATPETESTLQQIDETQQTAKEKSILNPDNSAATADNGTILASYDVGVSDLNRARMRDYYESGKANPFEEYKEPATESEGGEEGSSSGENESGTAGSSTGKLFENTKSK